MAKLDAEIAGLATNTERDRYESRIKSLESLVERQQATIDSLRASRVKLPIGKAASGKTRGGHVRIVFGDTHGAHIDKAAAAAFLADLEELKPAEIVMLGDHLDCGGWLAQHHVLGFVPETTYSYEDDCNAANTFLDAIQKRAPRAKIWYIEGNHEHRIDKQIIKMTCGNTRDCEMMRRLWGCKAVLSLEKRGIDYVSRGDCRDGLTIRGAIKLGKSAYTHGKACGANATQRTLALFKCHVMHGHNHRLLMATTQSLVEQTLLGVCPGCLCEMKPLYYDTDPTNWTHGYAAKFIHPDETFLAWPIPIVNGRSLLRSLLNRK